MPTDSHPLNRNLFIADNLSLLRRLDNDSIDLICIDPPFAKNQTFIGNLRPPLSAAEQAGEQTMLSAWGINSERDADAAGIYWTNGGDSAVSRHLALGKRRPRGLDPEYRIRTPRSGRAARRRAPRPQRRPSRLPLLYGNPPYRDAADSEAHRQPLFPLRL